jgi:hypothetical protein
MFNQNFSHVIEMLLQAVCLPVHQRLFEQFLGNVFPP